jgi:hypothetical protein
VLQVADPKQFLSCLHDDVRHALVHTLALDPRPHYQDDSERIYTVEYDRYEVRFTVCGTTATIVSLVVKKG